MLRNILRSKSLWAIALPLAFVGAAFAGEDCYKKNAEKAADAKAVNAADYSKHCNSWKKGITKTAKMTDEGAVVTLKGANDKAIEHIQSHLSAHNDNKACPTCPLSNEGVTVEVKMMKKGGKIMAVGTTPDTIKAIQDWAGKTDACCGDAKGKSA